MIKTTLITKFITNFIKTSTLIQIINIVNRASKKKVIKQLIVNKTVYSYD